jgi:hypothetical protein
MNHNSEQNQRTFGQWNKLILAGGIAVLIVFLLTLLDIIVGSSISMDLGDVPQTAIERFFDLQRNWLLGLYHLDLLNVIISIVMIPAFTALFAVQRPHNAGSATCALVLYIIATTIFVGTNTALPMLELSGKYHSATNDIQRNLYAAAGEALLARGEHGTPGVFIGFSLLTTANLFVSVVMVFSKVFKKVVAYLGIIGSTLLFIYIIIVTFVPGTMKFAVIVAAPGGISSLLWYLLISIELIKIGLQKENDN